MLDPTPVELDFEIGHVLFIDLVDYSKRLIGEQRELLKTLNHVVRETETMRSAEAAGQVIRLPTGDGMALIFRTSPEAPARCALELSKALRAHPELQLRMGIHSGPVSDVADVNDRVNIAGAGINIAQRVMDCGDAGHILLSKHAAEDLEQSGRWQPYLHELGECEVKHGLRLSLVNLYTDEAGNSALPAKFATMAKSPRKFDKSGPTDSSKCIRRWIIGILIGSATVIAALGVFRHYMAVSKSAATISSRPVGGATPTSIPEKSIAILPFQNLSEEKANAYFAEGIRDEILTKLSAVRDLKVISRTSTAKYQSKPENLRTVAQELGVSNILEGAVQRAGDKVRVNVQLIDAGADRHLWAKSYDRDLKDVLKVESEVSEEIAEALKANLSPGESRALAIAPTQDTEAHDLFLRGEYEFHQAESSLAADAYDRADAFYRQALAHDPNFAAAAAALVYSRLSRHWFASPLAPQELEEVKSITDRLLAVAPNGPEAHFALGVFFYWGYRQYEKALAEFDRTLELQPNNALARQFRGWIYRRRGEWERALIEIKQAQELNPRDPQIPVNMGGIYASLRLWKDAERTELRALAMDPHNAVAAILLCRTRLNAMGDIDLAQRVFDGFPQAIRTSAISFQGDLTAIFGTRAYLNVIERRFSNALQTFEKEVGNSDPGHLQQLAVRAALGVLAGQTDAAKSAGEEARPLLEARFRERPDDTFAMTQLAWVYLALGRKADTLRLARRAADSMPIERDALSGAYFQNGLAQIEAHAGAPEEAVRRLQHLLSIPAGQSVSIALLKIDPVWDPIRSRPDFQQLLSGSEQIGPNQ
jgi:TolB-like protein